MARKKWKYFIGVYINGSLHYVTEILDDVTKRASWEAGKEAKEFKQKDAELICEGLNLNMVHSVIVKAPSFMAISNDPN